MTDVQHSPCSGAVQVRSSGRLQKKYQRRFSMPSRKEELQRVVPDSKWDDQTPSKDHSYLRPRKLVNNFIKERNTYNNPDGNDLYDEFSDDDFIDDGEPSSPHEGSLITSESSSEDEAVATRRPALRRRRSRTVPQGARSGAKSESDEELAKPLKRRRQGLPADRSSGSDTSSDREEEEDILRRHKRRPRVSVESDESSDGEDELKPDEEPKNQDTPRENSEGTEGDALDDSDSDSDFIATSSSSEEEEDLVLSDGSDEGTSDGDRPSHEELICNYRQKERGRRQQRRVLPVSESGESSDADSSQGGGEPETGSPVAVAASSRRPSRRAERLRRKKAAWKTEVLGTYAEKRDQSTSKKKKEKTKPDGTDGDEAHQQELTG